MMRSASITLSSTEPDQRDEIAHSSDRQTISPPAQYRGRSGFTADPAPKTSKRDYNEPCSEARNVTAAHIEAAASQGQAADQRNWREQRRRLV